MRAGWIVLLGVLGAGRAAGEVARVRDGKPVAKLYVPAARSEPHPESVEERVLE